jgi:ubiquinone/menaquinone biosynthesis C-methylase UbiE
MDSKEKLKKFYDEEGTSDYQLERYTETNFFANRIKDTIIALATANTSTAKSYNILDIGAAEGLFIRSIDNRKGVSVSMDLSHAKVVRARKYANEKKRSLFVTGDAEYLPLRKEFFNGVIFTEVMEHLPEPEKALREINSVLALNGTLFLSVPTGKDRFIPLYESVHDDNHQSGHLFEFSKEEIKELLRTCGFQVTEVITIDVIAEVRDAVKSTIRKCLRVIKGGSIDKRGTAKSIQNSTVNKAPSSGSFKCTLQRLYISFWGSLDRVLSKVPILKRKGHFAIFIAKKINF